MKIGDSVSVIDEDLSGVITSVHGDTVVFKDEHGFTHRVAVSQIVQRNADWYDNIQKVEKFKEYKPKSKKHQRNHFVLDLHFEKLVDTPLDYDGFERLFIQKEKLLEALAFCRKNRLKKMEIIHGLGDGTLQKMVIDTLESQLGLDFYNKEILHHQSGAIMVEFH
ncbi:DNA mismatch repair protein [Bergeyella porcorum]|uniref:DNA mismatch repair protein n=1 Tax=Bergeyella porcorum TaxID=1735111 RepID=A0AAU0F1K0_9FLAO